MSGFRCGLLRRSSRSSSSLWPPWPKKLNVVERFQSIVRLNALVHRRLIVDHGNGAVLRGQHFEFGHLRSPSMEAGVFYVRIIQAALNGAPSRCWGVTCGVAIVPLG
jgi:hypothetical protein